MALSPRGWTPTSENFSYPRCLCSNRCARALLNLARLGPQYLTYHDQGEHSTTPPPGTTIFDRYPIPTLKPSNLAIVAKVDTLNRQGQTINTHRAPTQSPKFFSRAIYSNCSAEFYSIYQVDWQQPDVPPPQKK